MATGSNRRLIQNTREELLSTDVNRMQAFAASDLSEIIRNLLIDGSYPGFLSEPTGVNISGFTEDHGVTETPMRGYVLGGFLCRPVDGSLNIIVDPGVAVVVDPDATPNADDSSCKLVRDAGTTLALTTNTSGQTRIDVLECSRTDVVTESDSRNQYDTSTGLFSPVTFDKVGQGEFSYRIRAGTPGAGVPSASQGWMPLMVISVPTGTTAQLNACSFWDVRPLFSAKYGNITNRPAHGAEHFKWCHGSAYVSSSNIFFEAQAEVCDSFGYKLGGRLQGLDASGNIKTYIDLTSTNNQEPTFVSPTASYFYVYLATPVVSGGLNPALLGPRWVKYGRFAGSQLQPVEPAGFVIVSTTPPDENGTAIVHAPTSTGLGCVMRGYCVAVGFTNGSAVMQPFMALGRSFFFGVNSDFKLSGGTATANVCTWSMAPDTSFPRCARKLGVNFSTLMTLNANVYQTEINTIIGYQTGGANLLADLSSHGGTPSQIQRIDWHLLLPIEPLPLTKDATRTLTTQQTNANASIANTAAYITQVDF